MIDMESARRALLQAANDAATLASTIAGSKGSPSDVAGLVTAASTALATASEVITSTNYVQEKMDEARRRS